MDRADVAVAARLLAKAESTDAEEEAFALVLRTYQLLAKVITEHDLSEGHTTFGPPRRERRLLRDRRKSTRGTNPPGPTPPADTAARYRRQADSAGPAGFLDLDL